MKSTIQQQRAPRGRWPIHVVNVTGEKIPPYALMLSTSANPITLDETYHVTKPVGTAGGTILVNSPSEIAANGDGFATVSPPLTIAYDPADGAPNAGEEWGPHPLLASWLLSRNGTGFGIMGGVGGGLVRCMPAASSSSQNGDVPIIFIRNDSGVPMINRGIVGIGDPIIAPVGSLPSAGLLPSQPTFASQSPAPRQPFAVLLGDLPAGGIGQALTVGVMAVRIDLTNIWHRFAHAIDNNYIWAASAFDGPAQIVWLEKENIFGPGTLGVQWAFVSVGQTTHGYSNLRAVTTTAISAATGSRSASAPPGTQSLSPITPGTGFVQLYRDAGGVYGSQWPVLASGAENQPAVHIVPVENWMFSEIEIHKPVLLRISRINHLGPVYEVCAEGCNPVPEAGPA